jgi:hypothetical protein
LPVLDLEAGHTGELAEVVGDDGGTEAEGLGGEEEIAGADEFAAASEVGSQAAEREGIGEGERFGRQGGDEGLESGALAGGAELGGAILQLPDDDG